ncbi:hypothetical protein RMATCC62417_05337 [Rhizopus microsporus]|nr:hypothetical protein RMATCC62417_05337 [Rhizopus microsporus]
MKNTLSSPEAMGGWDELREDDKERIRRAWEEGDIPDNEKPEPAHSERPRRRKPKQENQNEEHREPDENDVSEEETEDEVEDEDAGQDENTGHPEYTDDEAHHDENHHKENTKHQEPSTTQPNRKRKIADQPVSEEEKDRKIRKMRSEAGRKGGRASRGKKKPEAGRSVGRGSRSKTGSESRNDLPKNMTSQDFEERRLADEGHVNEVIDEQDYEEDVDPRYVLERLVKSIGTELQLFSPSELSPPKNAGKKRKAKEEGDVKMKKVRATE